MIINFSNIGPGQGGGSGSGTELSPVMEFPTGATQGTVVSYAGSSSAAGVYQFDGTDWVPVGGDTEEIELPIAAAVNELKGNMEARLDQQYYKKQEVNNLLNEKVTAGQVNEQIKNYTDPAIAEVYDTIEDKELPVSAALNELNNKISEISGGSGGDMSAYWTSAQTQDAISAATSGKADAQNIQPSTGTGMRNKPWRFADWNSQGVITGPSNSSSVYGAGFAINDKQMYTFTQVYGDFPHIYAPTTSGNSGDILVSTGNGAPVWANDDKVSSASISTIWKGTQAEYDTLTDSGATADPNTFYIIINN